MGGLKDKETVEVYTQRAHNIIDSIYIGSIAAMPFSSIHNECLKKLGALKDAVPAAQFSMPWS